MVIWIILFALICASASSLRNEKVVWLKSPRVTTWGRFGVHEFCPNNSFVTGMRLKMDHYHIGDNTALNAIQLICTDMNGYERMITSESGRFGYFGKKKYCQNGFAAGFQLRSQNDQGFLRDDVAAVDFKLLCSDIFGKSSQVIADDNGFLPWGYWTKVQKCPFNSAVCGIATQVKSTSGLLFSGDRTSLNNVDIACCNLTRPIGNCRKLKYNWETLVSCATKATCEVNLQTGVRENKQLSRFRKFFDNKSNEVGSFNKVIKKSLQTMAEKGSVKINDRPLERILKLTQLSSESTVEVNCEGIIQQLVVTCDFIKFNTSESQCVPDQYADKVWEVNGLYFQPTSTFENIFWSYNCDFAGNGVGTVRGNATVCGEMCLSNKECTHFTWNYYNGGTCWMKGVFTPDTLIERHDEKVVCGWIERQ